MPLPDRDFDPSESALPWRLLARRGMEVRFATPEGRPAQADPRMITGEGLGPFAPLLRATSDAAATYREMEGDPAFRAPAAYGELRASDFEGLLLPGGHAPGMRPYLESGVLQSLVADFFRARKPVGAVCHGVLLAARSRDPKTGLSVLHGRRTTALLHTQERLAYQLSRPWAGRYYLTYERSVEEEVRSLLADPAHFVRGPLPLRRDDEAHPGRGFALRDGSYLSARWPGDIHRFAAEFIRMVEGG